MTHEQDLIDPFQQPQELLCKQIVTHKKVVYKFFQQHKQHLMV